MPFHFPLPSVRSLASIGALLLGWLIAELPTSAHAQPAGDSAPETNPPAVKVARFDINFPGGSPHALVDMLQEASGEPVNALIPITAKNFTLPPINYRNVTVEEVLAPLQWSQNVAVMRGGNATYQQEGYEWRRESGIWVMRVQTITDHPVIFQVEPVNVRRLLERFTIDDLTTAIDSAWKLQGAPAENQLLFHAETSLLILKGRPLDIETARNVLKSLEHEDVALAPRSIEVNVLGQVNHPGTYTLPAHGTLIEAIAKAGGETKLANRHKVTIRRNDENEPQSIEVNFEDILRRNAPATPLKNGDTVVLVERIP